ncbi:MAG: MFS transporter [Deltaproteobacteria bacterium]|nr:MFS transporter [Deltaproteobacteria bacterium]
MSLYRRLCLFGLLAGTAYNMIRFPVMNLYAASIGVAPEFIGFVLAASTVTGIPGKLVFGVLGDRAGHRIVLIICGLALTLPPLLYIVAQSTPLLVAVRFMNGAATAALGPTANALISELAPRDARGVQLGTYSSVQLVGRTVGPWLGAVLLGVGAMAVVAPKAAAELAGVPAEIPPPDAFLSAFVVSALIGAAVLVIGLTWPRDRKSAPAGAFNAKAPSRNNATKDTSPLCVSAPLRQIPAPAHPPIWRQIRDALRHRNVRFVGWIEAVEHTATGAIQAFLPLYAVFVVGLTPIETGVVYGSQLLSIVISKPFWGRFSDRHGRTRQVILGHIVCAAAIAALAFTHSFVALVALSIVYGTGEAISNAATAALVTDLSKDDKFGAAHGLFNTIVDIGHTFGQLFPGLIILVVAGSGAAALKSQSGYQAAYVAAACALVVSALAMAKNRRRLESRP